MLLSRRKSKGRKICNPVQFGCIQCNTPCVCVIGEKEEKNFLTFSGIKVNKKFFNVMMYDKNEKSLRRKRDNLIFAKDSTKDIKEKLKR